ncbi:MAG: hypothetical protein HQ582_34110, partial [Planctomycetes bacterium]|nr:hypothetical protein [Planctomycetota bacterium]
MPKRRLDDHRCVVRLLLAAVTLLLGAPSLRATDYLPPGAVLWQHPDPLVRRLPPT